MISEILQDCYKYYKTVMYTNNSYTKNNTVLKWEYVNCCSLMIVISNQVRCERNFFDVGLYVSYIYFNVKPSNHQS